MNKVIIADVSDSDCRLMSGLLMRAGYEPIIADNMEAIKQEETKLSPGAINVSAHVSMRYLLLLPSADQLEKHFVRSKVKCGFRGQMDLLFLFGRRCFVSHSRTGMS